MNYRRSGSPEVSRSVWSREDLIVLLLIGTGLSKPSSWFKNSSGDRRSASTSLFHFPCDLDALMFLTNNYLEQFPGSAMPDPRVADEQ